MEMKYLDKNIGISWNKKDLEGKVILAQEIMQDWHKLERYVIENYWKKDIHKDYVSNVCHDGNRDCGNVDFYVQEFFRDKSKYTPAEIEHGLSRRLYGLVFYIRHAEVFIRMMELENK